MLKLVVINLLDITRFIVLVYPILIFFLFCSPWKTDKNENIGFDIRLFCSVKLLRGFP